MKRSEMVAKLAKIINKGLYQDYQFSNEDVSDLLTEIEKLGMMPPPLESELARIFDDTVELRAVYNRNFYNDDNIKYWDDE